LHTVISATVGIRSRVRGCPRRRLDSRRRGNDAGGGVL